MPVGDLLAHCETWGIPASEVAGLLTGSSPATVETADLLRPVARAVLASGATAASIGSVDDIHALSPDARAAADTWLELHAWRTVTSDDVDRPTLAEVPALQLAALLWAADHPAVDVPDDAAVRDRVPPTSEHCSTTCSPRRADGHRQREDIRGLCWNWPGGLLRTRPAGGGPPTG